MTNASMASGREPIDARALVRAAGDGDAARVESLLAAGADANSVTESGETPLIRAASKGHADIVRLLLSAGADPNAEREDGFTALGVAVFFGYADVVRALIEGGADPSAKGRLGASAEKWARFSGFAEIAEMLRGAKGWEEADVQFFPSAGTFSPVVPLSEVHAAPSSEEVAAADRTAEVDGRALVVEERGGVESKEPEVATVVRPRASAETPPPVTQSVESQSPATRPRTSPAVVPPSTRAPQSPASPPSATRAKGIRRPWPLTVAVLAVSLTAGLAAGSYLMRPRPLAEAEPSVPPAEARTDENVTQAAAPASATATTSAQPTQPAPPAVEQSAPTEPESSGVSRPAPRPASPEGGRDASSAATATRREAKPDARAERRAQPTAGEKTADARRVPTAAAPHRPRRTDGRVRTSAPRDSSLPVFSPPPSSKSGKKKVIPWP
ncbi:MAG TPA: ankyrin repeat domain-containing protein [Pyrinomonadaceae bacterium]|nr:ankyrin repeat domain-containing protein [Pyrinomonadaceae bacterium]